MALIAAALILGVAGAAAGASAANSSNRASKQAGRAASAQQRDVSAVERFQRLQEAANSRARLRVVAAESGAFSSVRESTGGEGGMGSLLGVATSLFPKPPPPPTIPEVPAFEDWAKLPGNEKGSWSDWYQTVLNRQRLIQQATDRPALPQPGESDLPFAKTTFGPGSWQALERQNVIDTSRSLYIIDRNLTHELNKINAGVAANQTNPLLSALQTGLSFSTSALQIGSAAGA